MNQEIREKLSELRALCIAATPGPWYTEGDEVRYDYDSESTESGVSDCSVQICSVGRISETLDHRRKDRMFIAQARTALPQALDALEALLEGLDGAKSFCGAGAVERGEPGECLSDYLEESLNKAAKAMGIDAD